MPSSRDAAPVVTVIVTSDYEGGGEKAWGHVRAALRALARQDFDEPAEFLFVESEKKGTGPISAPEARASSETTFPCENRRKLRMNTSARSGAT